MTRYLITSALPYINGIKHLGNLIGSMLPADIYARFLRQQGHEVLFICGTDEHGTPAEIAAQTANKTAEQYCNEMYIIQKNIYDNFNLSFDYFGRTSAKENHQLTQEIFLDLDKNNYIEKKEDKQYFSLALNRFLPDRYIIGTCPYCKYEKARGDQCDNCTKLLSPIDLITPHSSEDINDKLELRSTKNLYFKLKCFEEELYQWLSNSKEMPKFSTHIAYKWLKEGLESRCITRDLKWGITVPKIGYEKKVFYVWFDAPNGYISITQEWSNNIGKPYEWKKWWLEPDKNSDVKYIQFMAKDNTPFHAIFWPSMLKGTKKQWKLPDIIKSFSWLNYEGKKFSTSLGQGIFLDRALELFPADYWRYSLISMVPEGSDSSFTFIEFANSINKNLCNVLGNFISRTVSVISKNYSSTILKEKITQNSETQILFKQLNGLIKEYEGYLHNLEFRKSIQCLRQMWVLGNEFITSMQPWTVEKQDKPKAQEILYACLRLIYIYAVLLYPIMPEYAQKIFTILNVEDDIKSITNQELFNKSHRDYINIHATSHLFTKIPEEVVENLI